MEHQKIKQNAIAYDNLIETQAIKAEIEHLLRTAQDGIIAFDPQGKIIAINEKASVLFGKTQAEFINHDLWQSFKLNSFSHKRQYIQARQSFLLAKEGIAQQFTWLENKANKPILAYNIMINKAEIHGTSVLFARITDILQTKIIEWVLWSLAHIRNHHEISEVIDEILQLISDVFSADYAAISLIDNQNIAHSVSYYHLGKKKENISYSLIDSPCEKVQQVKSVCYINEVQKKYPKDHLLKQMNIYSYLGGAITNAQQHVVGLLTVLKKQKTELDDLDNTLFHIFIGRINLELQRLLSQNTLQFMASIPQKDPNPVIRIVPSGDVVFTNTQGEKIRDYWIKLYSGLPEQILKEAQKAQSTNQAVQIEMEVDHKIYLFNLIWIPDFKQINIYGTDISQLKITEQNMLNLARFDALTQIANRQYFEEKLLEKLHEHHLEAKQLALLLIDLDDFKQINDTLGHPIGDRLLKTATKRMTRCLRQEDFIARLGGDEFIVLLNKSNASSAILVAEKIIRVLARTFHFVEYRMKITASIGIALYPEAGITTSDLLKHADIAMYQAKNGGKNHYAIFSKSVHYVQDKRNDVIKKELKLAAAKNQLYIVYQPQIAINSNKIIGVEALLRWNHPEQGLILPSEFIPVAEQTGCSHIISQWLIKQSLHDCATLLSSNAGAKLSINVSLSQLNDARLLDSLCENLQKYKTDNNIIILDISERALAPHFKEIAKSLRTIHNMGVKICLDNFGSPQVPLPKLLVLPINYLKLDQLLLQGIEINIKNRLLLKGIISLAKELHLIVIQKGIETEQQHHIIKSIGCQYAQGHYYCRPLQIHELQQFIKHYMN